MVNYTCYKYRLFPQVFDEFQTPQPFHDQSQQSDPLPWSSKDDEQWWWWCDLSMPLSTLLSQPKAQIMYVKENVFFYVIKRNFEIFKKFELVASVNSSSICGQFRTFRMILYVFCSTNLCKKRRKFAVEKLLGLVKHLHRKWRPWKRRWRWRYICNNNWKLNYARQTRLSPTFQVCVTPV